MSLEVSPGDRRRDLAQTFVLPQYPHLLLALSLRHLAIRRPGKTTGGRRRDCHMVTESLECQKKTQYLRDVMLGFCHYAVCCVFHLAK